MTEASPRRRYTLAILLAVYACNFMDRQILAILKPAIKQELGLSRHPARTALQALTYTGSNLLGDHGRPAPRDGSPRGSPDPVVPPCPTRTRRKLPARPWLLPPYGAHAPTS